MTELIIKMLICLIGALVLGFVFGYLISKLFGRKKHVKELDMLNALLTNEEKKNLYLRNQNDILLKENRND